MRHYPTKEWVEWWTSEPSGNLPKEINTTLCGIYVVQFGELAWDHAADRGVPPAVTCDVCLLLMFAQGAEDAAEEL